MYFFSVGPYLFSFSEPVQSWEILGAWVPWGNYQLIFGCTETFYGDGLVKLPLDI